MGENKPNDIYSSGTVHKSNNYGCFKVLRYLNARNVTVEFIGSGCVVKSSTSNISAGSVRDPTIPNVYGVGFMGEGKYKSHEKNIYTKSYSVWYSMLTRCYSEKYHERQPTYKDCTVCDEWLNYQTFSKWFEVNYPADGGKYQIDKDIKQQGVKNKIYSADYCMFVTHKENTEDSHAKHYKFKSPSGEIVKVYNLREFCKDKDITPSSMGAVHLGKRNHHKQWTKA